MEFVRDLFDYLPEHCEAVMLQSSGTIMNNTDMGDFSVLNNIVCAFLPQISNVKIKFFKMTFHMSYYMRYQTEAEIQDYIQKSTEYKELINTIKHETSRSNDEISTCFMLLGDGKGCITNRWASAIQRSKEKIKIDSIIGGVVNRVLHITKKHFETTNCIAVLITGVIQTWTITLDTECETMEQIEARLKSFKNKVKLKKHSIGFELECGKRRYFKMYKNKESTMEITIFKKLFPKVPLVGCAGFGQFGKDNVVNEQEDDKEDEKNIFERWLVKPKFSTVFLILTYD